MLALLVGLWGGDGRGALAWVWTQTDGSGAAGSRALAVKPGQVSGYQEPQEGKVTGGNSGVFVK